MIIAFTCYYTKGGITQSVGIMELGSETIAHYCLFFYGQCSGNGFIPQFYIQTVSDIGLFYLVYKWMVSEMDSHLW